MKADKSTALLIVLSPVRLFGPDFPLGFNFEHHAPYPMHYGPHLRDHDPCQIGLLVDKRVAEGGKGKSKSKSKGKDEDNGRGGRKRKGKRKRVAARRHELDEQQQQELGETGKCQRATHGIFQAVNPMVEKCNASSLLLRRNLRRCVSVVIECYVIFLTEINNNA